MNEEYTDLETVLGLVMIYFTIHFLSFKGNHGTIGVITKRWSLGLLE